MISGAEQGDDYQGPIKAFHVHMAPSLEAVLECIF